jgi:Organic solute transporter Ostalpha
MSDSAYSTNNYSAGNNNDEPVTTITFSLAPASSSTNCFSGESDNVNDSAMMDDDLNASLLPQQENTRHNNSSNMNRMTASHLVATAARPHSGLRLVMRKIGNFLAAFTLLTMLVVIPVVTYEALSRKEFDVAAFDSAGVMVLGTVVLSIRLVYLHFTHWYMPHVQKYIIRILFMVPLYSVQSWLSLAYRDQRIYIDAIRDVYEAYVIASFLYYLIELLGGQDALVRTFLAKARDDPDAAHHLGQHGFPLSLVLEPWDLGLEFMLQCKHGVLQYVVVKAFATVLTFGFQSLDCYGEGEFRWDVAYPYMAFFLNMSVMYALYCLVKLFHAVNDELRHPIDWHPLGKFLCVKGVVFFTWWQGVIIYYLYAHGIIKDIGGWTGEEISNGLIDYCICIEMVFFAIAHSYTFTYTEYLPATVERAIEQYNANSANDEGGTSSTISSTYQPPAMLSRPMRFRDALWSSTVPSETLQDIRRLQSGVDQVVEQANDPGLISLQDMNVKNNINGGASIPPPRMQSIV